jgi:hypothetical protein
MGDGKLQAEEAFLITIKKLPERRAKESATYAGITQIRLRVDNSPVVLSAWHSQAPLSYDVGYTIAHAGKCTNFCIPTIDKNSVS